MLFGSTSSASNQTPNFLIPNGTIIVEFLLFVIVLGIVSKFILPPLQQALDERAARMRDALEASDEGRAEAERLAAERIEVLERARASARAVLEEAARTVEETRAAARARGEAERERLLEEADVTIEAEGRRAREELAARLGTVVLAAAERLVGMEIDPSRHQRVLDEASDSLRGGAAVGGDAS